MAQIELGNNYTIEENSNGDLVITDSSGSPVLSHDDSADQLTIADQFGGAIDLNGNDIDNIGGIDINKLKSALDADNNDINNAGTISGDTLEADSIDITPVASGTTTVSANSVAALDASGDYTSDYYDLFLSTNGDTADDGAVKTQIAQFSNSSEAAWQVEEQQGNDITINWAIIKIATQ